MQAADSGTPATARAARAPCTCGARAIVRRPSDGAPLCRACFLLGFENGVLAAATLRCGGLLRRGALVAVGASGGKDSAVLAHVQRPAVLRSTEARVRRGLALGRGHAPSSSSLYFSCT
jgi:hypothetical protein